MSSAFALQSEDFGKLLLRMTVGGLMIFHGISKLLHGIGWMPPMLQMHGIPGFLAYGVFVAEVITPVAMFVGWRTRLFALTIVFEMVMVIWLEFRDRIFTVKPGGGGWTIELEVFFLVASLALYFMGAGKYRLTKTQGRWE